MIKNVTVMKKLPPLQPVLLIRSDQKTLQQLAQAFDIWDSHSRMVQSINTCEKA